MCNYQQISLFLSLILTFNFLISYHLYANSPSLSHSYLLLRLAPQSPNSCSLLTVSTTSQSLYTCKVSFLKNNKIISLPVLHPPHAFYHTENKFCIFILVCSLGELTFGYSDLVSYLLFLKPPHSMYSSHPGFLTIPLTLHTYSCRGPLSILLHRSQYNVSGSLISFRLLLKYHSCQGTLP